MADKSTHNHLSRIAQVSIIALIVGFTVVALAPTPEPTTRPSAGSASTRSPFSAKNPATIATTTPSLKNPTSSSRRANSTTSTTLPKSSTSRPHPAATQSSNTTTHHHSSSPTTAGPQVIDATAPTAPGTQPTQPSPPSAGSHAGGTFCNGWIRRVPAASHLTIFDSTNGQAPTSTDCTNAHTFYNATIAANAKYADINVAIAGNYKPGSDAPTNVARHYVYWGARPGVANPNAPEGLVYRFDSAGHATLIGVYFYENSGTTLNQPAGPLTIWHAHSPTAQRMLHVWTFPGVRDPFALMLSGA